MRLSDIAMSELKYSRLLCSPRPALGAALSCCRRPQVTLCYLRDNASEFGASLKSQLERLTSAAVPKVSGLLHDLPRVFCSPTTKFR